MANQEYYVSGNTAEGFINYISTNVEDFSHVISLKHPSNTVKTAVIKKVYEKFNNDFDIEMLYSSLGSEFLDGIIVREKSLAIVTDTIASDGENGVIELDLNLFIQGEVSENEEIVRAKTQFETDTQASYANFSTGLKIHDDLESIYIKEMDFNRADQVAADFIKKLLQGIPKNDRTSHTYHRLFGTNTSDGVVNVVPELLQQVSKSYFIKGRAGTGKSTFMKKIANACTEHGFDIELYHCSFDPNSIDMVLVRELDFCIFDSTDPHEFFPAREGETAIDLYEEAVTPGTDEKFADEINKVHNRYKSYMKKGIVDLKNAGANLQLVEEQYKFAEKDIERITNFIVGKVVQ